VFDTDSLASVQEQIRSQTAAQAGLFVEILRDARALGAEVRAIQPRSATSISLVASDGGNNRIEFNPFLLQLIRVVDSYGDELFRDVITPSLDVRRLGDRHLDEKTPLGRLMTDLGVGSLPELSPMLPVQPKNAGWVLTYRDICEWAILYDLIRYRDFGTDTLIVRDGLLRSKIFQRDLFVQMYRLLRARIEELAVKRRRDVFLVGLAKHSKILQRYAMAITVAGVFPPGTPCFAPVPLDIQRKVYQWEEYVRPVDTGEPSFGEDPKFNIGRMYLVRFGRQSGDPIWTVDLLESQQGRAQEIFGCLLADALDGFPIPFYPNCLQQADHHAQVVDFDLDILRDTLADAVRALVDPASRPALDALQLATDVARRRYE